MKKILQLAALVLLFMAGSESAYAQRTTVTFDISNDYKELFGLSDDVTSSNQPNFNEDRTLTKDGVSLVIKKNNSSNNYSLRYSASQGVRLRLQRGHQLLVVGPEGMKVHKIRIPKPGQWSSSNKFSHGTFTRQDTTWTDNAAESDTVTINIEGSTFLSSFIVEYVDGNYVPAPQISKESGNYIKGFKTAIVYDESFKTPADTKFVYTIDGTDPTTSSTAKVYNADDSVSITGDTYLRAVAQSAQGYYSEEVDAEYHLASSHIVNNIAELEALSEGTYCTFNAKDVKVITAYFNRGTFSEAYLQDATGAIRLADLTTPGKLSELKDGDVINGTLYGQSGVMSSHTPTFSLVVADEDITLSSGAPVKPMSISLAEFDDNINRYVSTTFRRTSLMQTNSRISAESVCSGFNNAIMHASGIAVYFTNTRYVAPLSPDSVQIIFDEDSTNYTGFLNANKNIHVVINKTFKAGEWTPFCSTFSMTAAQVKEAFGDDVKVESFSGATENSIEFTDGDTSIVAGIPYIINVSKDLQKVNIDNVAFKSSDKASTVEQGSFKAIGTWSPVQLPTDGKTFVISGNTIKKVDADASVKALSMYLVSDNDNVVPDLVIDGKSTTGINEVKSAEGHVNSSILYNLSGQRVSKSYKGIIIQNGKKFVQK